jgi:N-ethylmaleimide reductase
MPHPLFQPYDLGGLPLANRTLMAPMTRCRAGEGDVPTALMAEYYAQRAGAGLIVTEGVPVSPRARGYLWTPGIYTPEQIAGWKMVADAVHAAGGKIFAQIWHVGRISHTSLQPGGAPPQGPTDQAAEGSACFGFDEGGNPNYVATSKPEALTAEGIAQVTADFAQAAENALAAGLDGVEIHGANGYLFDEFLNAGVNTRADGYGGSPADRARFLLETVDAAAARIGANRVGVRISPYGQFNSMPEDPETEATFLHLAAELDRRGVAFLHVNDQRTFGLPAIPDALLPKLRAAFKGPIVLCGGYDRARAEQALDAGLADLIGFGVPFLANPDLPARLANGWPLNEPNRDTFYGGGAAGYTDYPRHSI